MSRSHASRPTRRQPRQRRARQTVEAVLDAVGKLVRRHGVERLTTNRIAAAAGVSIGSLYQYFADKQAIFQALHERHAEEMGGLVERTLVAHAASPLEELLRALLEALVEAHAADPALHEVLLTQVPPRGAGGQGLEARLHGVLRLALSARVPELGPHLDLDQAAFVAAELVGALSHAVALRRPPQVSRAHATREALRAILAYLRACGVDGAVARRAHLSGSQSSTSTSHST